MVEHVRVADSGIHFSTFNVALFVDRDHLLVVVFLAAGDPDRTVFSVI